MKKNKYIFSLEPCTTYTFFFIFLFPKNLLHHFPKTTLHHFRKNHQKYSSSVTPSQPSINTQKHTFYTVFGINSMFYICFIYVLYTKSQVFSSFYDLKPPSSSSSLFSLNLLLKYSYFFLSIFCTPMCSCPHVFCCLVEILPSLVLSLQSLVICCFLSSLSLHQTYFI